MISLAGTLQLSAVSRWKNSSITSKSSVWSRSQKISPSMPTGSGSARVLSLTLAPVPDEPVIDGGDGSGFGAVLAVAGGAAVVGAAGFGIYELATRAILKDLLPEGTAIPATRGELALLLWQNAGRPEPAALPAFADTADTETAKAAQWCTEQGLLTAEDGAFHPEQKVTKYRVIRIWKQAAAPQQ